MQTNAPAWWEREATFKKLNSTISDVLFHEEKKEEPDIVRVTP